jgi:hypothetical protein
LCARCDSDDEVVSLMRYMDPNADGDLSLVEVEEAFKRAERSPEEIIKELAVARVIGRLDAIMEKRKKRCVVKIVRAP